MPTTLIAGLPRSGTTLLCVLINQLPDAVALAEPMPPPQHGDPVRRVLDVDAFVAETRRRALREGTAISKAVGGQFLDNFSEPPTEDGRLRRGVAQDGIFVIGKDLSEDFHLFIKHPGAFTALADRLVARYAMIALVRDPLAVLASWQTVDMPVQRGRQPAAELFDPKLRARLEAIPGRIDRQVELISWSLSVYARVLNDRVIRFEDLVADPVAVLRRLHPGVGRIDHPINTANLEDRYSHVDFAELARALRPAVPHVLPFYPDFVENLDRYDRSSKSRHGANPGARL